MLKFCNNDELQGAGLAQEYILFYQCWKELTEIKTFDTYQYKSFNILNGIEELIHNIGTYLEGIVLTTHSITSTQEELLELAKTDIVLTTCFSSIRNRLIFCLCKNHDTIGALKALRYQLCCYHKELEHAYDLDLTKELSNYINNNDPEKYIVLTATFISRCVSLGWSVQALSNKIDSLKVKVYDQNCISEFLGKTINARRQEYTVFFPFRLKVLPPKGKTKEESTQYVFQQLNEFNTAVMSFNQIIEKYPRIDQSKFNSETNYIQITIESLDTFSASHLAISKLSQLLNVLSFFSTIESWSINNSSWITYNINSPYTKKLSPEDIYGTYEYLDSSSVVYNRTKMIMLNHPERVLSSKLLSSFSYANLSRSSMTIEEKYINMWVALESLSRTDSFDNIISNIVVTVPNALCMRYIYRIVRNFIEDCIRCRISLEFTSKSINPMTEDKESLVVDIIHIFRDSTLFAEMCDKCKINSLLLHRCHEIYKFLSDVNIFAEKIKMHRLTVNWHLDRLYRIRNEIAHSASFQRMSTIRYIEHLYDYLATFVSEIVRIAETKSISEPGEIISLINDNYKEFEDISNAKKIKDKSVALGRVWETGIIDFF